jgi:hypothetical protein
VFALERLLQALTLLQVRNPSVDYADIKPFRLTHMRRSSIVVLLVSAAIVGACSDSSGPGSALAVKSGDGQTALAGTPVPAPIVVTDGTGQATFSVLAGGGSLSSATGQVNSDGTVTAPTWTLGKSDVPQQLQVTSGSNTAVINATVKTSYKIDVRFFGRALTADQKALFTNAAARIRAIIVGAVPAENVAGGGVSPDSCGSKGVGILSETITGLVIYASIDSIDGPRKILAQSGPCYIRSSTDFRTLLGIMKFDSADIVSLAGSGNLQEVITHEMLHVVGFGSFWDTTAKNLLINYGPNVSYIGPGGISGCKAIGGVVTCANSVPVEGTQGGDGTINSHWREVTFGTELMTGFLNSGSNPLSVMTIRSLEDLGYVVDPDAADPFSIPGGSFRASFRMDNVTSGPTPGEWERPLAHPPRVPRNVAGPQNLRSN